MEFRREMAILPIVLEGDPRLRQKASKIRSVDDSLRKLAADMHETMNDAPGVGLAGPQVGVMRRIIVVFVPGEYIGEGEPDIRTTLINPEIIKGHGCEVATEGCLSIPSWVGDVPRYEAITVKAMNLDNKEIRIKAKGYFARVIQHEVDHLDGILFVDRVEDKSTLREVQEDEEGDLEYAE
jgi:peptide deformylase